MQKNSKRSEVLNLVRQVRLELESDPKKRSAIRVRDQIIGLLNLDCMPDRSHSNRCKNGRSVGSVEESVWPIASSSVPRPDDFTVTGRKHESLLNTYPAISRDPIPACDGGIQHEQTGTCSDRSTRSSQVSNATTPESHAHHLSSASDDSTPPMEAENDLDETQASPRFFGRTLDYGTEHQHGKASTRDTMSSARIDQPVLSQPDLPYGKPIIHQDTCHATIETASESCGSPTGFSDIIDWSPKATPAASPPRGRLRHENIMIGSSSRPDKMPLYTQASSKRSLSGGATQIAGESPSKETVSSATSINDTMEEPLPNISELEPTRRAPSIPAVLTNRWEHLPSTSNMKYHLPYNPIMTRPSPLQGINTTRSTGRAIEDLIDSRLDQNHGPELKEAPEPSQQEVTKERIRSSRARLEQLRTARIAAGTTAARCSEQEISEENSDEPELLDSRSTRRAIESMLLSTQTPTRTGHHDGASNHTTTNVEEASTVPEQCYSHANQELAVRSSAKRPSLNSRESEPIDQQSDYIPIMLRSDADFNRLQPHDSTTWVAPSMLASSPDHGSRSGTTNYELEGPQVQGFDDSIPGANESIVGLRLTDTVHGMPESSFALSRTPPLPQEVSLDPLEVSPRPLARVNTLSLKHGHRHELGGHTRSRSFKSMIPSGKNWRPTTTIGASIKPTTTKQQMFKGYGLFSQGTLAQALPSGTVHAARSEDQSRQGLLSKAKTALNPFSASQKSRQPERQWYGLARGGSAQGLPRERASPQQAMARASSSASQTSAESPNLPRAITKLRSTSKKEKSRIKPCPVVEEDHAVSELGEDHAISELAGRIQAL